jgi:hypothetical protein
VNARKRNIRTLALVALVATNACSGAAVEARPDALSPLFARSEALRAKALAPDLYARAERARQAALRADGDETKADLNTQAHLLLEAAVAEADRISLERTAVAADRRATRAIEQRAKVELERLELAAAEQREAQAITARRETEQAFQVVALEQHRPRVTTAAREAERVHAAEVLRKRAQLSLAAAAALGLSKERTDELEQAIASTARARGGSALLAAAQGALAKVELALGEARAAQLTPPARAR